MRSLCPIYHLCVNTELQYVICIVSPDSRQYTANMAYTGNERLHIFVELIKHCIEHQLSQVQSFFLAGALIVCTRSNEWRGYVFPHSAVDFLNAPLKLKMKQRKEDRDKKRNKKRITWSNKAKARETCLEASSCYPSVTLRDSPVQRAPQHPLLL